MPTPTALERERVSRARAPYLRSLVVLAGATVVVLGVGAVLGGGPTWGTGFVALALVVVGGLAGPFLSLSWTAWTASAVAAGLGFVLAVLVAVGGAGSPVVTVVAVVVAALVALRLGEPLGRAHARLAQPLTPDLAGTRLALPLTPDGAPTTATLTATGLQWAPLHSRSAFGPRRPVETVPLTAVTGVAVLPTGEVRITHSGGRLDLRVDDPALVVELVRRRVLLAGGVLPG